MNDVVIALDRQVEHAFETGVFAVDRRRLDRLETAGAIVLQCSIIIFLPGDSGSQFACSNTHADKIA